MQQRDSLPKHCLALFDDGAADPVGAGEGAGDGNRAGAHLVAIKEMPGDGRRERKAGAAQRRRQIAEAIAGTSGTQEGTGAADATVAEPESRRAKFRALVDGEFKDLYTEAVQSIIDRRFRQTKTLEERLAVQQPIVEALLAQYGIHDGDVAKLTFAMRMRQGNLSGAQEQPDRLTLLEQENRTLRAEQEQRAVDGQYDEWLRQAEAVRTIHSGFDLRSEVQNPQFLSMLKARVPMQHAYEVLHLDDIKGGVARQSAERTEKRVVDGIRAKGARPVENGISSQNGIPISSGISQLSRTDRAELARRAARGERITL